MIITVHSRKGDAFWVGVLAYCNYSMSVRISQFIMRWRVLVSSLKKVECPITTMTFSGLERKNCLKTPTRLRSSSIGSTLLNSILIASFGNFGREYHQTSGRAKNESQGYSPEEVAQHHH